MEKRLLSIAETAEYLGISPKTLYNRISLKGKVPFPVRPKRLGRRVLFDRYDLDRFIDGMGEDTIDHESNGERKSLEN